VTLLTVGVAAFGRTQVPVEYKASSVVRVIPYSNANPSYTQLAYADRIMKTYVQIGSGSVVMSTLREEMNLQSDQPHSVEITNIPDTELLKITITDSDPILASNVANALASYLANDKSIRDVRVTLLEPAAVPEPPSRLFAILFYGLAGLAGAVGGIGLAFLMEGIDPGLYEEKQVTSVFPLPIVGYIPRVSARDSRDVIATKYPQNHAFRRLAANLLIPIKNQNMRTIMVTSAEPRDGKSTIAVNLAHTLAQTGLKTLLIDGDLYRPTIHKFFEISNDIGLRNLLLTIDDPGSAIFPTTLSSLWVMPSGTLPDEHEEFGVDTQRVAEIFAQVAEEYDFIVLDSPAFLGVADSLMLSSLVDGVLMVVRLGKTGQAMLRDANQQLESVQAKIIGVVLNTVRKGHSVYYPYYQPKQKNPFVNLWRNKAHSNHPPLRNLLTDPGLMQSTPLHDVDAQTPVDEFAASKKSIRRKNGTALLDEVSAESIEQTNAELVEKSNAESLLS
jgi:capsular exopolysaccharide synthesis family protein